MFDLAKTERYIILFLVAALLVGISLKACQRSDQAIDVKIRSFAYEPSGAANLRININEADEEALDRLDGVGPSLAKRIVVYRAERGRFTSVEELKKVKGIGEKLFEKIKDEVSVE